MLLAEMVIFTGSGPLMMALVAYWHVLNTLIYRATGNCVLLVGHLSAHR